MNDAGIVDLYWARSGDAIGETAAKYGISVIDFPNARFMTIDRDTEEVGNEHYVDWFDNDTVMVDNNVTDETGRGTERAGIICIMLAQSS